MTMFIGLQENNRLIIGGDSAVCKGDGNKNIRVREDYFDKLFCHNQVIYFIGGVAEFGKKLKENIVSGITNLYDLQYICLNLKKELNIADEILEVDIWLNNNGEITYYLLNSANNFKPIRDVIPKGETEIKVSGFNSNAILGKVINKYYKQPEGKILPVELIKQTFDEVACHEVGGVCKLLIAECRGANGINVDTRYYILEDKYSTKSKKELTEILMKHLEEVERRW